MALIDILKEPWNLLNKHSAVGVLIGIVGVLVAIISLVLYILNSTPIDPIYATSPSELIAKTGENAPRMTILWDGSEVSDVRSVKVAFWNSGSEYIDVKNIPKDNPIQFVPSEKVEILSVELLKSSRENLKFNTSIKDDSTLGRQVVQVDIVGDEAIERLDGGLFKVLYTGKEENVEFSVNGRIKGAPEGFKKKDWNEIQRSKFINFGFSFVAGIFAIIGISWYIISPLKNEIEKGLDLFSWDDVPGNDSEHMIEFLKYDMKIEWVENAEIKKSDDDKVITVTNRENSIAFNLKKEENKVTLKINGVKSHEYILKEDKGNLNIYNDFSLKNIRDDQDTFGRLLISALILLFFIYLSGSNIIEYFHYLDIPTWLIHLV
ncbi:hypothetical protein BEH94_10180 [Candidatus Altiarchaeales archaeon WOR_SM1_SCG]|nr:hypothetical protein BEH94_10180 [Candidatus Altiarchaeales archaeon WOR_SM1_SCG]